MEFVYNDMGFVQCLFHLQS